VCLESVVGKNCRMHEASERLRGFRTFISQLNINFVIEIQSETVEITVYYSEF
jgi:hypothetical protein